MKIWILASETPVFNPGGIARYVDNFARFLARAGHTVLVFGREEEAVDQEIEPGYRYRSVVPLWNRCGEKTDSPRPDEHPSWPYNILDYWGAFSFQMRDAVLEEIAASGPPDVIESQEYGALPYYLLQHKLTENSPLRDIPIVVNCHSPDFICRRFNEEPRYQMPNYWIGRMEMASLHAADALICPSDYLSRQLEEEFGKSISVRHFPLPWTDPKQFGTDAIQVDSKKAVYFGRLEIRKGVLKLLDECTRLWNEEEDFTLHLIGGDTHYFPRDCSVGEWIRLRYKEAIDEGRLVIHEAMAHDQLMAEIRTAAFTLVPSLWENWPNTCIEAMSLGKVVIGSRHGGQGEMIGEDASAGFVFSWENKGEFAEVFLKALHLGEEERALMGEAARQRISGLCHPEIVLKQRISHFEELVSEKRPRDRFPFINRCVRESTASNAWPDSDAVKGRISVIIPYYNLPRTLAEAIDSSFASNWADLEVIVVDDGNRDPEACAALEAIKSRKDSRIQVLHQANTGLAGARNAGVREATGEWVLLLDADDAIEPEFIPRAVAVLRQYRNVHVVYSWERYFEASDDIYPCWNFEFPYLIGHNMTCPVSLLYRDSYRAVGGSKERMAYNFEDHELWINFVKNGFGGVALQAPLTRYRIRQDSMWQGSNREQHLYLHDLLARIHPEVYREYGDVLFGLQNANGSAQKWIKPSAFSPYDEYERWSRRRMGNLEKEANRWWKHSVEVEKRLTESEQRNFAVWQEKNRIEKELLSLREAQSSDAK